MNRIRSFVLGLLAATLMGAGAFAQVDPPPAVQPQDTTPPQTQTQTTTTVPRDDGFNWGWIGLVGLLGLAGLTRREAPPVHRDPVNPTTRPGATTTHTTPPKTGPR